MNDSFGKPHIDFSRKPELCDEIIRKLKENFENRDCHLIKKLSNKYPRACLI